jgi:hypothetical protein
MYCTECGNKYNDCANFCQNCGKKLNADIPDEFNKSQQQASMFGRGGFMFGAGDFFGGGDCGGCGDC